MESFTEDKEIEQMGSSSSDEMFSSDKDPGRMCQKPAADLEDVDDDPSLPLDDTDVDRPRCCLLSKSSDCALSLFWSVRATSAAAHSSAAPSSEGLLLAKEHASASSWSTVLSSDWDEWNKPGGMGDGPRSSKISH